MSIESSQMRVSTEQETAGAYVLARSAEMEDHLNQLRSRLSALESTWVGQAQADYLVLREQWSKAATDLFGPAGVLGSIGAALNTCWSNYSAGEQANMVTWQGGR